MTDQEIELGRRLMACDGFHWMAGMLGSWKDSRGHVYFPRVSGSYAGQWADGLSATIDTRDPATKGCLLHLVREAWGHGCITVEIDSERTRFQTGANEWEEGEPVDCWDVVEGSPATGKRVLAGGYTEAEALVTALEAAPSKGTK